MEIGLIALLVTSLVLITYHHVGYPLLLKCVPDKQPTEQDIEALKENPALPSVGLLIPAYNEAKFIADKIFNLASLDYPEDKLQVILACDGCSDNTAEIARNTLTLPECQHLNMKVVEFEENRGKIAVVNCASRLFETDLLAMSDVSALLSLDALLQLSHLFNDEKVGLVCSHYHLIEPGTDGEETYWRYQSYIKQKEASLGSVLGAHGAFYAIRRRLFKPLEHDTINDDFILPMRILEAGYTGLYAPHIHAVELEGSDESMDFNRRTRIAAGNIQQIIRLKRLLSPSFGGIAFAFMSGKTLRMMMPWLMLIALVTSFLLWNTHWAFAALAIAQTAAYLLVMMLNVIPKSKLPGVLNTLMYLVNGHAANLIGTLKYLFGQRQNRWHSISE